MTTKQNGLLPVHYHNSIKSTINSAVYQPVSSIITTPLTDKYTVGENVGRGKFAVVKKCTNKQTGEVLAAKFIKKRRRGKTCREEILREVVMLEMALNHPRLVNFKEVYETQQELILITEYCAGGELFTECILEEKFNEADVRLLMSQILEGLVYLHDKNIVHLDLKPQNILLTDEFPKGSVKICDLGFACLVNTGEDIRDIIGTPDYVAPEVLNYDPLGLYTDMWSLGVLTYVMLTTCSPFAADDKQQTFSNITSANLDFPEDLFGSISVAAQDFIKKLLILEPRGRMTARQCFQHQWLSGLQIPNQRLTCIDMDNFTSEIQQVSPYAEDNKSVGVVKSNSREKIQNQTSKMSLIESLDENVIGEDISDVRGAGGYCLSGVSHMDDFSLEVSNENEGFGIDSVGESERRLINIGTKTFPDDDKETKDLHRPMATYLDVSLNEGIEHLETIAKNLHVQNHLQDTIVNAVDILPNTDKLSLETYSEMVFGNDFTNPDSVYVHEASLNKTRVEPEPEVNQDNEELYLKKQAEDSEMFSENLIEKDVEIKSLIVGDELDQRGHACIGKDLNEILEENGNINKGINREENDDDIEMEESDVEHSQNMTRSNENNSSDSSVLHQSGTDQNNFEFCNTNLSDSDNHINCVSLSQTLRENQILSKSPPFASKNFGDNTNVSFLTSSGSFNRQDSVSNTEDSMNNMQFGERLKRTKSSVPNVPNNEQQDTNEEIEYEYVSVSKRVKSFEAISTSKPALKNPPCSPKIQRSPRIGRHCRHHTHPH